MSRETRGGKGESQITDGPRQQTHPSSPAFAWTSPVYSLWVGMELEGSMELDLFQIFKAPGLCSLLPFSSKSSQTFRERSQEDKWIDHRNPHVQGPSPEIVLWPWESSFQLPHHLPRGKVQHSNATTCLCLTYIKREESIKPVFTTARSPYNLCLPGSKASYFLMSRYVSLGTILYNSNS